MADVTGVKISDLTAAGSSDGGEYVWITHRLGDGSEYPLIYPYEAVGYLITVLTDAARTAYLRRVARNPQEAALGMDSNIIPIREVRTDSVPENAAVILHLTTADKIAIAVELPTALLREVTEQFQRVLENQPGIPSGTRFH